MRSVSVPTLEWRAGWFSDPAKRLQFLRRKAAEAARPRECARCRYVGYLRSLSATGITFLVMLTNTNTTAVLPPDALRAAGASSIAQGLEAAEIELRADGAAQNLPVGRYREKLQKRYRDAIRALRGKDAYQEYN
jgi:hypothetical protein